MALNFPDSEEILNRIRADVKQLLPDSDPYVVTSIINALATAYSNRFREIYDQLLLISRDTFVTTAEGQALLERALINGVIPTPATSASGNVIFTGTLGTTIDAGTDLIANEINYQTQSSATIATATLSVDTLASAAGTATCTTTDEHGFGSGMTITISGANETEYNGSFVITVTGLNTFEYAIAGTPASPATGTIESSADMAVAQVTSIETGLDTNIIGGGTLQLTSAIIGVDSIAYTQFDGIDGGDDAETLESVRDRTLQRIQNPNTPFNAVEIETKAREVEGVTRVFVFESNDLQRQTSVTITTLATGICEITFPINHDIVSGMKVLIQGANEPLFNGTYRILKTSDTTLVYFSDGATGTATGTITCDYAIVQLGQVAIYFLRDNDENIIPSASEIEEVKNKILEIKPANTDDANVFVEAPVESPNDFQFVSLEPNTQGIRDSIVANLGDLFDNLELGQGVTEVAYNTAIQNSFDSVNGIGVDSFSLASPIGDLTADYNEILTINSVSFP